MPPASNLPSSRFAPRIYGVGAWTDNLHFAYDLVATLQPALLVELGTDRGESYFAFCQAAAENKTGTRCFAVDTWRGDHQAGDYDETTFREVSDHNGEHYPEFSTLLRQTFDVALGFFADGSIDVLHLDGLHTEEAVRHDLASWLPKLRPGGILLLHDVAVRGRDFGVWKLWDELRRSGRSFTFPDGPGLGVWQKPPCGVLPEPLESLLGNGTAQPHLTEYYRACASDLQQRIAAHWRDGTIRTTPIANQSVIQVFHTHDGAHREDDSVLARIGHGAWKEITLPLPAGAGAAPLRIDFLSALTTIELAELTLATAARTLFRAGELEGWDKVAVGGDAEREADSAHLRVRITGIDPQLYLPVVEVRGDNSQLRLTLRLRVHANQPAI